MSERDESRASDNEFLFFTFKLMAGILGIVFTGSGIVIAGVGLFIQQIQPTPEELSMAKCIDMCEEQGVEAWTMDECVCSALSPENRCRYLCGKAGVCSLSAEGACECYPSCEHR